MTSIQWMLFSLDDWTLSGLDTLTHNTKSLILALALWQRRITLKDALVACRVEELEQQGRWGEVQGYHDVDNAALEVKSSAASLFLHLLNTSPK
jgi:ATP synthase F1 complex assembly factor 2